MGNNELCITCKERPIVIKKWRRCIRCYQNYRRIKGLSEREILPTKHQSEIEFVRSYFTHSNWKHHPANFRFDGHRYQPDFYDGERNVFIEVVGTRQAFSQNKAKYKEFIKAYPKINFEIRQINGDLVDLNEKLHFNKK